VYSITNIGYISIYIKEGLMTEKDKVKLEAERLMGELNALIERCNKGTGFVYVKDKIHNDWFLRLTEPVKIEAFVPSTYEEGNE
jgi:hypothetical protein